ncbi:hypothetical protein BBJ29_003223 [Phytophthora kernoviae]|uniref:Uncharacterized protein n=1 Tax=Phytophthora kernoviae TaxID=325452 RepID=A0A3F2RRG9_9STRA|nr:hypothetical protein BBJ29_003223 [Phytophthora kernoviae]RLN62813.1 hypothetical protein BBP00_00004518 [Phytophthora kernoviae]
MDDECDMLECCLCGALCGACCASAASDGDDGRRRGRYSDEYRNGQQPVYVQPVVVQQQPGYGPPPPGHPGYGPPPPGYGPPPGEYHQYPPQQYPPGQYPPPQQQQYPHNGPTICGKSSLATGLSRGGLQSVRAIAHGKG